MLISYVREDDQFYTAESEIDASFLQSSAWLDLIDPTDGERTSLSDLLAGDLPKTGDVEEIEATARSFVDEDGIHLHSLFLHDVEGKQKNTSVAFTLTPDRAFTLREREIPAFRLFRMQTRKNPHAARDSIHIALSLLEIKIDDLADTIEEVYQGLEGLSASILEANETRTEDALDALARHEDTNGKIRLCLMDTQRGLGFLLRHGNLDVEHAERARELLRDIDSLLPHNTFVFDKINFLMDAAQGFINIEQNQIIKTFSIAAAVFLPPTLIASIYGMNFRVMPELDWVAGYPIALVLMVLSGIAPYAWFKHKGWL